VRAAAGLTDEPGKDAWPLTCATFIQMHKVQDKPGQAAAALNFFDWAYGHGDEMAAELDFVPMPTSVKEAIHKQWQRGTALSVPAATRRSTSVARLVCRMYGAAPPALRARLLACLVRPLGTLGVVGVAAGAFAVLLYRSGSESARAAMGDMARLSNDQMFELARFVEQVSPDALLEFARLFTERSMGMAAFSASAALLLTRALRQRTGTGASGVDDEDLSRKP